MKPPISYYGGKQRLASKIVPLIPQHTVYVEPFAGGAAILFAKPWPDVSNTNHYREVINDKDNRLINFYRVLQDKEKCEELIRRLELTLFSESEHKKAKDLNAGSDIDQAWAYYVNISQSFAHVLSRGWGRAVFGRNSGASWARKVALLPQYIERMASVVISCQDGLTVIKQFDSPQTFFYCDPPYPGTDQGSYKGYTIDDYRALCETLASCQGSFLLSNYDQALVDHGDWEKFEFASACSASGKGRTEAGRDKSKAATDIGERNRTEIVWRRFNTVEPRPEIQKLYASGKFDCFAANPAFQKTPLFQSAL